MAVDRPAGARLVQILAFMRAHAARERAHRRHLLSTRKLADESVEGEGGKKRREMREETRRRRKKEASGKGGRGRGLVSGVRCRDRGGDGDSIAGR